MNTTKWLTKYMCLFFETIAVVDGMFRNIDLHTARLNHTRQVHFRSFNNISLAEILSCPENYRNSLMKCRVIYAEKIEKIEFEPYQRKEIRTLKLVHDNSIRYDYKYFDRANIERLIEKKGGCDDIIIVKNGLLTDTSYSNIALCKGREWVTPASPLFNGIMRESLISAAILSTKNIGVDELHRYQKIALINALNDLENCPVVDISGVEF